MTVPSYHVMISCVIFAINKCPMAALVPTGNGSDFVGLSMATVTTSGFFSVLQWLTMVTN